MTQKPKTQSKLYANSLKITYFHMKTCTNHVKHLKITYIQQKNSNNTCKTIIIQQKIKHKHIYTYTQKINLKKTYKQE